MKIEMTNKGLDMSIKDDLDKCRSPFNANEEDGQEICRSLVCDPSGIIFAEMVYRCMICLEVTNTMSDARKHYVDEHTKDLNNSNCTDQIDDLDDIWPTTTKNIPKHLNKKLNHQNNLNNNHTRSQNGNRNSDGLDSYSLSTNNSCTNKYRNSLEPIDMSPSSDSFERYQSLVTINDDANAANGSKSGYINCAVCSVTKYYSNVQRRYGQLTCVTCYRYFKQFFDKPEKYSCPKLGQCQLNVRTKCKACWIKACINLFQVDLEKQQLIEAFAPLKKSTAASLSASSINNSEDEHLDALEGLDSSSPIDEKMDQSDDNNNNINNGFNGHMNHSKEALSMMLALNGNKGDLPNFFSKSSLSSFNLLTAVASSQANSLFGNLHDNNNNSLINHHSNLITNSLTNSFINDSNGLMNGSTNSDQNNSPLSFLKPKRGSNKNLNNLNGSLNNLSNQLNGSLTANNLSVNNLKNNGLIDAKASKDTNNNNKPKVVKAASGKKVWSCGKCETCVAEDCGKCIYCLDRPKFGGPFVKKQRCIKRRCLNKIKTKADKKNNNLSSNNLSKLSTNALPAVPTF